MIKKLKVENRTTLYVDAGNLLFGTTFLEDNPQADLLRERARLIARSAVRMGATAVNVGRQELLDGLAPLERLAKEPGVPFVSANLQRKGGGYPFPRWRTVAWGPLKVGVFGLLRPEPNEDARLGLEVGEPEAAAREAVKALKGVDAVLCLSNLGLGYEARLAADVPGVTVIVGGGSGEYLAAPQVVGDTLIVHAGDKGKHLGVLDVASAGLGSRWTSPRSLQEAAALDARLQAARAELASLGGGTEADLLARWAKDAQRLRHAQSALRNAADLQRLKADFERARAVYSHRVVTLEPSAGEDPEIAGWVKAFKAREADWAQRAATVIVPGPVPPPSREAAAGPRQVGSTACRACHAEPYRRWLGTAHSRSYLALRGRESERPCHECHTTALLKAEGPQIEPDVGCEACHGPGGNHRTAGNIARVPPEEQCRRCHRGFHEKESFDYRRGYEAVRCDRRASR